MLQFEGVFELFDLGVRRLQNGNKLKLVLECQEDLELEKQLICFREEYVKAAISRNVQEQNQENIFIEETFEVFEIKCRRLRNGSKLRIVLEQQYDKAVELQLVKLRYDEIKIFMEKIEDDLFEDNTGVEDIEDPEV